MALYDSIDLNFSWDGDYMKGPDGDLLDTSEDYLLAIQNDIRDCVKSVFNDWEKDPTVACDLDDYRGEANTRDTGSKIEQRVKNRLVNSQIVKAQDIFVRVTPVTIHEILISIRIQAQSTTGNNLRPGEPLVIAFLYDSNENNIFYLPGQQKTINRP